MIIKSQKKLIKSQLVDPCLSRFSFKSILKESVQRSLTGKNGVTNLELSKFPNLNRETLDGIVKNFPWVKHINLSGCIEMSREWFTTLANAYADSLQTLNLECCHYITDEDISALFGKSRSPQTKEFKDSNLVSLVLSYTNLSDLGMQYVTHNCPNLQVLKLQGMKNITNLTLSMIAKHCPKLYLLDIRDCDNVNDYGIQLVCQELKNLEELYMSGTSVSNQILPYLCYYGKKLRVLDIKNTKITGDGLNLIARSLVNIESLKISGMNLIDNHVRSLIGSKVLKTLDISFCYGLSHQIIKEIIEGCATLNELFLFGLISTEDKPTLIGCNISRNVNIYC